MITQQQFLDAVADFEGLIHEDHETSAAIRKAARSIGMRPVDFERRLTRDVSIEALVRKIRHDAEYNRFLVTAKATIAICKKKPSAFADGSIFDLQAKISNIQRHLEGELGRELSEHEVWKIGEMLDPFGTQLKMEPKDRRIIKELLHRQIEC